ncbi:MAG: NTP transferase domain-containing protein [Deltaproteobacteria bacterium]|nr:NTP transferase domain-containing protein [Deltaproteobacteria bacterium]
MKKAEITGVILSAGLGSRIKPLSFDTPKPLLPVCNKPIMQYQIESLSSAGIRDIVVVVGYLKEKIMEHFGDGSRLGVRIRYIEQEKALGIAHAVGQIEGHIQGPFLLFLGDIFTIHRGLGRVLDTFRKKRSSIVLVVKREDNQEFIKRNFAIQMGRAGLVKRVIEKPRYAINDIKGCGIYLFDLPIFDAIRRTPRTALRDEYEITNSIQILIEDGYKVHISDVVEWDMNVTVPQDLHECNMRQLKSIPAHKVIGQNVVMPEGTEIINSVIGNDVKVASPIRISDSVILSGVSIDGEEDIAGSLVSNRSVIERRSDVAARV